MKNYIKISIIIFSLPLAFSCSDDEKGASVVGTWDEVSFVASGCDDPDFNENYTCTNDCERIVVTESTVKFGSDPAINYTIDGDKIVLTQAGGGFTITISVKFEVSETSLIITADNLDGDGCKNVSTYKRA